MLTSLRLSHFKGFRRYGVTFKRDALLIGPNNAGKSTLVGALRLGAVAARTAMRVKPSRAFQDGDNWIQGYPLTNSLSDGFVTENVRHEFRDEVARIDLTFSSKAVLHVVWPVGDADSFFWVEHPKGNWVKSAAKAKEVLSSIGIVPMLTPLEHSERVLSEAHIRANLESRLASRHFRNQLWQVNSSDMLGDDLENGNEYEMLMQFLLEYTPEISSLELADTLSDDGVWLDMYYKDIGSNTEKEIYWAGDGMQIWLQVLFHIWRNRLATSVILDEPDVFLHPDLQRRLVHVLDGTGRQTIMATHAAEVASEAHQGTVIWVDRTRTTARRVTDEKTLAALTSMLGSGFNLAVARALRSKVALFVEGDDMKVLRILSQTLDARRAANESGLTVIGIGGFSNWPSVETFSWLKSELLGNAVQVRLILDSDFRSPEMCKDLEAAMDSAGVATHIWRRKELESYLIEDGPISRISGLSESEVGELVASACEEMKNHVRAEYVKTYLEAKAKPTDTSTATEEALTAFDHAWDVEERKRHRVPAKNLISALNRRLQAQGRKTLTARNLAKELRVDEISEEMRRVISDIEASLA